MYNEFLASFPTVDLHIFNFGTHAHDLEQDLASLFNANLLGSISGWPAVALKLFGLISAEKEAPLEELNGHHGEDKHEEQVDDQDVEHILQRVHHAIKHSLRGVAQREKQKINCI